MRIKKHLEHAELAYNFRSQDGSIASFKSKGKQPKQSKVSPHKLSAISKLNFNQMQEPLYQKVTSTTEFQ